MAGELATLVQGAADYAAHDVAGSTRSGYQRDLARFETWVREHGLGTAVPSSPEVVSTYLAALASGRVRVRWVGKGGKARETLASKKLNTLRRAYSAITYAHRAQGIDWPRAHPAIVKVMKGIARRFADAPEKRTRKVSPIELEVLSQCLAILGDDLRGQRDKVMLLVGFFACLRRSELAVLNVTDIEWTSQGMVVIVRKSKTDQTGQGERVGVPRQSDPGRCPVTALRRWLDAAGIREGRLLRGVNKAGRVVEHGLHPGSIAALVKGIVERAGYEAGSFSGHSLRSGFATAAGAREKSLQSVMAQGRWKSERQAMRYIRHGSVFVDNAAQDMAT